MPDNTPKIDKVKLSQMLRAGKTQAECARFFGCSQASVSSAVQRLSAGVVKATLERGHRVLDKSLDAIQELHRIHRNASEILEETRESKDHQTALRALSEIRQQLDLQLRILATLYDIKKVAEFQHGVLEVIAEAAPDVKREIVKRLQEAQALRRSVQLVK